MREVHTAEEIRDEVARLLNAGRKKTLRVPLPTKLALPSDPFDDFGADWAMPSQAGWDGNREDVRRAILAVKAKWDMV